MENKVYKYVGITVIAFFVITLVIRLFHLNTKVIEGLSLNDLKGKVKGSTNDLKGSVNDLKIKKKQEEEEKRNEEGTPIERTLLSISRTNEWLKNFLDSTIIKEKDVVEDLLLELDETCDMSILFLTLQIANDAKLDLSLSYKNGKPQEPPFDLKTIHYIENIMSYKKAIAQSIKYLTSDDTTSKISGGITGMFS